MSRPPALTVANVERAIGLPFQAWAHQCHRISLAIVNSGLLPGSRVARGTCENVGGQHSWIVVGPNPYAHNARIVDPTLWSYDPAVIGIWQGTAADGKHRPHGAGDIFAWGKPTSGGGPEIRLSPEAYRTLGRQARAFLRLLGPLDRIGWAQLAEAPVEGWPAAQIIAAMDDTPALTALVPIDKLGMLTDRNPDGLYLPTTHREAM